MGQIAIDKEEYAKSQEAYRAYLNREELSQRLDFLSGYDLECLTACLDPLADLVKP